MRHFVYYSKNAPTKGNFSNDLMKAGRMDIALHIVIAAFFTSHEMRNDVKLHLVFDGKPDPTKHIELKPADDVHVSKKDVAGLIKRMLYKYKKGEKKEIYPGCFIEKKSLNNVVKEIAEEAKVYYLATNGTDIRKTDIKGDVCFILGDQDGIPKKELKMLKKLYSGVSVGPKVLFASQTVVLVQNELDRLS